jgi:hypothetical protein
VNVYLRLQLTCLLLLAICCCRLCLFRVLLDTCPFCFLQYSALPAFCNCRLYLFIYLQFMWGVALPFSPVELSTSQLLLQAFPSPITLGKVAPLLPSPAHLFTYSSCEGLPLPLLSSRAFHMTAEGTSFPLSKVAGQVLQLLPLWPACLFTVCLRDCPSPTLRSWGTLPSLLCVFFFF